MPADEALQIETESPVSSGVPIAEPETISAPPRETNDENAPSTVRAISSQIARNAAAEVEHLKKLLSDLDAAKRQAQNIAASAYKELKSAEVDNNRLRNELKRVQDLLAFEKQERGIDLQRTGDLEASLRNELVDARRQASKAIDTVTGHRKRWVVISVGILIAGAAWFGVTHWHPSLSQANAREQALEQAPEDTVASASEDPPSVNVAKVTTRDFAGASTRLDQALSRFKGEKMEAVLRRVHKENAAKGISVCSFAWNNGQVSLLFGAKEGMDVDAAMSSCADAVEKSK